MWKQEECYCGCGGTFSHQSIWVSGRRIALQVHSCAGLPKPKRFYTASWVEAGQEFGDASWNSDDIEEYIRRKTGAECGPVFAVRSE